MEPHAKFIRQSAIDSDKHTGIRGCGAERGGAAVNGSFDGKIAGDFREAGKCRVDVPQGHSTQAIGQIQSARNAAHGERSLDAVASGVDFQRGAAFDVHGHVVGESTGTGCAERHIAAGIDERQQAATVEQQTEVVRGIVRCAAVITKERRDFAGAQQNFASVFGAGGFQREVAADVDDVRGEQGVAGGKPHIGTCGQFDRNAAAADLHGFRDVCVGGVDGQTKGAGEGDGFKRFGDGDCEIGGEAGFAENHNAVTAAH